MANQGNDFTQWRWSSEHVQTEIENGEFLSAESTLILSGPPSLSKVNENSNSIGQAVANIEEIGASETILFPIGLLSTFTASQARNIQTVYEIGSTRRYLVPEKIASSLRVDRAKFFGPSLLRVLYAYYPRTKIGGVSGTLPTAIDGNSEFGATLPDLSKGIPGYGPDVALDENRDFWINLQSVAFRQPLGLCCYMKASNDKAYGAAYMEECLIGRHTFGMSSDRVMMMEGVDIEFDRVAPIQIIGALENQNAA